METVRFDAAFMFAYSPRPGTPAALEPETITEDEKGARLAEIIEVQHRHTRERLDEQIGKDQEILLEGASRKNPEEWLGKTAQFRKVLVRPGVDAHEGQFLTARIEARRGHILWGSAIS